jgi:hypothetical protein
VTAKPEAEPDVSTRPAVRPRPEITIRTVPPAPVQPRPGYTSPRQAPSPPPRVVERHQPTAVEPPRRQAPAARVERPAPPHREISRGPGAPRSYGGGGGTGGSSGGSGFLSLER